MKLLPIYNNTYATVCCYKSELIFIYTGDILTSTIFSKDILDNLIKNNGFKLRKPYEDK